MYRLLFFFFISTLILNAQWILQNPNPTTNILYSLSVPNDSCIFAGGWEGIFVKSIDKGQTWTVSDIAKYPVWNVHFFNSDTGLAVSSDPGIFRTEDGGATWKKTSDRYIYKFCFLNNNTGWATGYGVVLKTNDGGKSWSAVYDLGNGTNYNISSIDFVDDNYGWVAGTYGLPLRTTNGGVTWTDFYYNPGFNNEAYDLDFIDTNNGWLLSNFDMLYKTSNGGKNWTSKYVAEDLDQIEAPSLQVTFISGRSGIYKSSNGGADWTKIYNGRIQYLNFTDELHGYALHQYSIIKTTDGGITWTNVSKNIISEQLNSIDFCDNKNGVIVGGNGTILTTNDRGLNWNINQAGTGNLNDIKFQKNKTGWIAGDSSLLLTSSDSGKTWNQQEISSIITDLKSISFYDDEKGVIAGYDGMLFYTSDGGSKWNPVNIGRKLIQCVHYLKANTVWAACDSGIILQITNGQINKESRIVSYTIQGYQIWIRPFAIHFFDEMNGIVAAGDYDQFNQPRNGWIYKTTDGGNTWNIKKKRIDYGLGYQLNIKSLFVMDSVNICAVSQSGEIFRSTDKGESWGSQSSPVSGTQDDNYTYYSLNDIYFFNSSEGLIVGDRGIILTTNNNGGDIIDIISEAPAKDQVINIIPDFHLYQNYPNPFNPATTIKFSIAQPGLVSLRVYDQLGKEAAILVNEYRAAGEYSVNFDASHLSSGIYLYCLSSGNFIQTRKLILLK